MARKSDDNQEPEQAPTPRPTQTPTFGGKHHLTREDAQTHIRRGGGVIVRDADGQNERIIVTIEELPDDMIQTPEDLDAQIAALQARRDALVQTSNQTASPPNQTAGPAGEAQSQGTNPTGVGPDGQ
ncbi:MAG: hypothetical protein JO250_09150 [Armatimonadetes bacterium]|nr:hypothetical protein [Armatimonadota bacterium]